MVTRLRHVSVAALALIVIGCRETDLHWIPAVQHDLEIMKLERRLESIESRLSELSRFTMHTGAGSIGYRSAARPERERREWIQIDWDEERDIDEIVIVPTVYRTASSALQSDGFPADFRVVVGSRGTAEGTVVGSFTVADRLLPRIAPLVIPCKLPASWLRLETTALSPRAWDGKYVLQLSEILVFSRGENIALHKNVTASSTFDSDTAARHVRFLVDGFVPYIMNSSVGENSAAFVTEVAESDPFVLTIDLGVIQPLSGILLHAVDVSDNVPQAHENTFGIPRWLKIDAANDRDFGSVRPLCDYRMTSTLDAGPIIALNFPETRCRFVRLTVMEPGQSRSAGVGVFGLAEIECLSSGSNVSLGKPISVVNGVEQRTVLRRSPAALTDGNTFYGRILPLREWLGELAERHELERERPVLQAMLKARYELQRASATLLVWICGAMAVIVALSVGVEGHLRRRAVARTRTQIAADLHDELGANLHAIALCSDVAKANQRGNEKVTALLDEMRTLADRSSMAVRSCVNMLESRGLYGGLATELRRVTGRLLADIDHRLDIESEEDLASLPPKLQVGLALFYKECLTNIIRHARATHVVASLTTSKTLLTLAVENDGRAPSGPGDQRHADMGVPASLRRRARLMGGRVAASATPTGGAAIVLRVTIRPWWEDIRRWIHGRPGAATSSDARRG